MARKKLLDTDSIIKIGDIFKTNKKIYQGEKEGCLKLVEISDYVFINSERTYLMEDSSGKRFYFGRSWVIKIKDKQGEG